MAGIASDDIEMRTYIGCNDTQNVKNERDTHRCGVSVLKCGWRCITSALNYARGFEGIVKFGRILVVCAIRVPS